MSNTPAAREKADNNAEPQRQKFEYSALLEASRAIPECSDFEQTARRIFDSCKKLTGAAAGYVALLNKDGTENLVLFLDAGGLECTVDPSLPMPVRGLRAEAYGPPATVYENNFSSSPWVKFMPHGHVHLENVLFAPLVIKGKAVGVMGLANKPGGFTEWDASLATAFGEIAAVSLYNSWALEELAKSDAEIKKLNEALVRHSLELEAANEEVESVAYSVSHDLREPLRAIDGFSRNLLEGHAASLDNEAKRMLYVVSDNTRKMGHLIDGILAYSRAGRQEMSVSDIDMGNLARVAFDDLLEEVGKRHIAVEIGALPPARGDLSMLRQVWINLFSNAIKFTRTRSAARIEVGGATQGAEHVYYMKDNGAGFDMEYAHRLFGVFRRLHVGDEFGGTGIGLAIAKRIITKHGGRVWAEGRPGDGATFYFALPDREIGHG